MTADTSSIPVLPHLSSEFLVWLWWSSEVHEGHFKLGDRVGQITLWVDDRIAFRAPTEVRVTTVITGDNPSVALEARAALAGGKVVEELRIGLRRDERDFFATVKGSTLRLQGVKLPQVLEEGGEEVIYDRMHAYEEFHLILQSLFELYAGARTSPEWQGDVLPAMKRWASGLT